MTKQIDRDTLSRKLAGANPPVLAEALPEKTFSDWHLPAPRTCRTTKWTGSRPRSAGQVGRDRRRYCANRSCQELRTIGLRSWRKMGYQNVAVYAGGKPGLVRGRARGRTRRERSRHNRP